MASTLSAQQRHINVSHLNGTQKTVTIDIPRGVNGNMQMKYAGHGDHSYQELPAGDLYISFRILRHPDFEIEGLDLIKSERISSLDVITGSQLNIVTLEGKELSWTIPAGTQHGARFRLGQYGLWNPSHPVRGSLIVQVNLSTPTNLTPEQLSVIERLSRELKTGNT